MGPIITVYLEESTGDEMLSFLSDMTLRQFNEFRKILISEVPTVALDFFEIIENDSIICNEVLTDRMSIIPIRYDRHEELLRKDLCDCDIACEKCSFMISFNGKKGGWLMSEDISPLLLENIQVVYLAKSHKVKFNAICTRGVASWHSKWNLGVTVAMRVINKNSIRVMLNNTGTYSYDYILREAFSIMKSKLNVNIIIQ